MTGIVAGISALTGVAFGWWGAAAVLFVAASIAALRPSRETLLAGLFVVAISAVGAWRSADASGFVDAASFSTDETMTVISAPIHTGQAQYFKVRQVAGLGGGNQGLICVTTGSAPSVRFGDRVTLFGEVLIATDVSTARRASLEARGCGASMFGTGLLVVGSTPSLERSIADVRSRIGSVLRGAAPGDAGVLLNGLVTGDDAGFSPQREEALLNTGTTHLTAVSGANLALVAGILAAIGSGTIGRHRAIWQLLTIGGVWAYAVVSGAHAPAVRAAIVATAAIFAFRFGRRPDFPTLILLAAGAMALYEPRQITSLGFQLSVAASLALAWVLPALVARPQASPAASVVFATAAAQIATAPLLLPVFGALSVVSLPANVVAAPMAAVAMPLALLAGLTGLMWMPLGEAIAAPASLVATVMLSGIDYLAAWGSIVRVGVPTTASAWILAALSIALLIAMSADSARRLRRSAQLSDPDRDSAMPMERRLNPGIVPGPVQVSFLPPFAPGVFAGEHPTNALAAHAHDSIEEPAGEKEGHQVTENADVAQALSRDIVNPGQPAHVSGHPEGKNKDQDRGGQQLAPPAHDGVVTSTEIGHPGGRRRRIRRWLNGR